MTSSSKPSSQATEPPVCMSASSTAPMGDCWAGEPPSRHPPVIQPGKLRMPAMTVSRGKYIQLLLNGAASLRRRHSPKICNRNKQVNATNP